MRHLGPYIKDVHTEGGGGFENCQILRTNSTDRLREMRTKGGGGVENPKNFADVLYVWSLTGRENHIVPLRSISLLNAWVN